MRFSTIIATKPLTLPMAKARGMRDVSGQNFQQRAIERDRATIQVIDAAYEINTFCRDAQLPEIFDLPDKSDRHQQIVMPSPNEPGQMIPLWRTNSIPAIHDIGVPLGKEMMDLGTNTEQIFN